MQHQKTDDLTARVERVQSTADDCEREQLRLANLTDEERKAEFAAAVDLHDTDPLLAEAIAVNTFAYSTDCPPSAVSFDVAGFESTAAREQFKAAIMEKHGHPQGAAQARSQARRAMRASWTLRRRARTPQRRPGTVQSTPRPRGSGRPAARRTVARSSSRSGDSGSGDSADGEGPPDRPDADVHLANAARTLATILASREPGVWIVEVVS